MFQKKIKSFLEFENKNAERLEITLCGDVDKIVKRVEDALSALESAELTAFEINNAVQGIGVRCINYQKTKKDEVLSREVYLLLAAQDTEVKAVVFTEDIFLEGTKEMFRVAANALREFERE